MSNKELGNNYLVLLIILNYSNPVHTYALINSGGSAITFINTRFVALHKFLLTWLRRPLILNIINDRAISLDQITYYTKVIMRIQNYSKRVPFILTNLGHYPIILGIKWL